jgi:hypothetical protein
MHIRKLVPKQLFLPFTFDAIFLLFRGAGVELRASCILGKWPVLFRIGLFSAVLSMLIMEKL